MTKTTGELGDMIVGVEVGDVAAIETEDGKQMPRTMRMSMPSTTQKTGTALVLAVILAIVLS